MQVYTLFDNKAEAFMPPFYASDEANAKNAVIVFFADAEKSEGINPVDFDLFHLGSYSQFDGKFAVFDVPKHLLNVNSLKGVNNAKNA